MQKTLQPAPATPLSAPWATVDARHTPHDDDGDDDDDRDTDRAAAAATAADTQIQIQWLEHSAICKYANAFILHCAFQ